jgi:hypothetical protein
MRKGPYHRRVAVNTPRTLKGLDDRIRLYFMIILGRYKLIACGIEAAHHPVKHFREVCRNDKRGIGIVLYTGRRMQLLPRQPLMKEFQVKVKDLLPVKPHMAA